MPLNYTPIPLSKTSPVPGQVGAALGNAASGIGSFLSNAYNGIKNAAQQPIVTKPSTNASVGFNSTGIPQFQSAQPFSQNYSSPAAPTANSSATSPKNPSLGTPAAQQYMGSLASNQVNIGTATNPNIQTNGVSQPNASAGTSQPTNGLSQQQAQQGYSTIPGAYNPVTGAQTSPLPSTPSALGTSTTQNPNVRQIDPNTGLPLTPVSNQQTDSAYNNYLQSFQLNTPVANAQAQLSLDQAAVNPQQLAIGARPQLASANTGEAAVAFAQDQQTIQSDTARLQQAQSLQGQQQQQALAGLNYSQGQQQLNQNLQLGLKPIATSYGQQVFNPATGTFSSPGGTNLDPQTQASQLAQAVASGQTSYADAVSALGYAGGTGAALLQQAIRSIPGANLNQLEGQSAATQSNATTAGTAQQQAALSAYVQSYPAVQTLNQNLNNITSLGNMTVQNAAGNNVNPFAAAPANATLASIKTGLSNVGQVTFNSNITALQQAIQALYAGSGGNTPAGVQTAIGQMADGSLSVAGLQALLTAAQAEGQAKLSNATATATSEYNQTQGNSSNTSSNASSGGWGSLGD